MTIGLAAVVAAGVFVAGVVVIGAVVVAGVVVFDGVVIAGAGVVGAGAMGVDGVDALQPNRPTTIPINNKILTAINRILFFITITSTNLLSLGLLRHYRVLLIDTSPPPFLCVSVV